MNEIHNLDNARLTYLAGAGRTAASPAAKAPIPPSSTRVRGTDVDRVEFSTTATQLAETAHADDRALRLARIARIRTEIENGTYDVNSKLAAVIDRVLADALA